MRVFSNCLVLIGQRSADLTWFIAEYARVARLPEPPKYPFDLVSLLEKLEICMMGRWFLSSENTVQVWVLDRGCGLANPANLFVPFYTTKDKDSGIGLVLCRQIANAHGGRLQLESRKDQPGSVTTPELR